MQYLILGWIILIWSFLQAVIQFCIRNHHDTRYGLGFKMRYTEEYPEVFRITSIVYSISSFAGGVIQIIAIQKLSGMALGVVSLLVIIGEIVLPSVCANIAGAQYDKKAEEEMLRQKKEAEEIESM